MDLITALALTINNPLLRTIDIIIDNDFFYAALIAALVLAGESRNEKRLKIFLTLAIVLAASMTIKVALAIPRPCAGESWCPSDYGFPSLHAVAAFTLMMAFLNKRSYPAYLLFALFVSFTRLNLGVHIFVDIAAALSIALVGYYAVDLLWRKNRRRGRYE
jgi:membrane-associated phospholipid phosphatase